MTVRMTLCALGLLFLMGVVTYGIKQRVSQLDNQLVNVHKQIAKVEESHHVLTAEWAYLSRPERLQSLLKLKRSSLRQTAGAHLASYEEVFSGSQETYTGLRTVSFKQGERKRRSR